LEPGTMTPIGRGPLRDKGELPMIAGQASYPITIELQVVDSPEEIERIEAEAQKLVKA
jgi:hypothetical protein